MPAATAPADEAERLAVLQSYDVLDRPAEKLLDDLAALAARLTASPIALISLIDRDRQYFLSRTGLDVVETPRDAAFCAHAILTPDQILVVQDATADPRFADNPLVLGAPNIRAYAGAPLLGPERQPLGTLCVIDREPRCFDPGQLQTLEILARAACAALELQRTGRLLQNLALTDPLTGLANRRAFLTELDRAIARFQRDRRPFALLAFDLDGFKSVNDRDGHAMGDQLLRATAAAAGATLRRGEAIARLGGDEFAALLETADEAGAAAAGERVRKAIAGALAALGHGVTASVGAVLFPAPPADAEAALAAADAQLYAAKRGGRNQVCCAIAGSLAAAD